MKVTGRVAPPNMATPNQQQRKAEKMNTTDLPYEQELDICDKEIARYTKRREELITIKTESIHCPEIREGYELTGERAFGEYMRTLGHDVPVYGDGYDRGAVMHALMVECSCREQTAFGYVDLAIGKCREKFHTPQKQFYAWRDGGMA